MKYKVIFHDGLKKTDQCYTFKKVVLFTHKSMKSRETL